MKKPGRNPSLTPTSEKDLRAIALEHSYRPEILEKVYHLLDLIEIFMAVPFLKDRLALKGGTAINLFCTDQLPRLSLDADFNYVGALDRSEMLKDKAEIDRLILDLCQRSGYELHRNPRAHAGGKMVLSYQSLLGSKGKLELDLNYLYRTPLWPLKIMESVSWLKPVKTPVLDIHELAAGKLHALLGREAARDLFDSHQLLTHWDLDYQKLRLAFTVYAGMRLTSWRLISTDLIRFEINDLKNKLIPVLKQNLIPSGRTSDLNVWAKQLVKECVAAFDCLLPFSKEEQSFLSSMEEEGLIIPDRLSDDENFCFAVRNHPALLWRIKQSGIARE